MLAILIRYICNANKNLKKLHLKAEFWNFRMASVPFKKFQQFLQKKVANKTKNMSRVAKFVLHKATENTYCIHWLKKHAFRPFFFHEKLFNQLRLTSICHYMWSFFRCTYRLCPFLNTNPTKWHICRLQVTLSTLHCP